MKKTTNNNEHLKMKLNTLQLQQNFDIKKQILKKKQLVKNYKVSPEKQANETKVVININKEKVNITNENNNKNPLKNLFNIKPSDEENNNNTDTTDSNEKTKETDNTVDKNEKEEKEEANIIDYSHIPTKKKYFTNKEIISSKKPESSKEANDNKNEEKNLNDKKEQNMSSYSNFNMNNVIFQNNENNCIPNSDCLFYMNQINQENQQQNLITNNHYENISNCMANAEENNNNIIESLGVYLDEKTEEKMEEANEKENQDKKEISNNNNFNLYNFNKNAFYTLYKDEEHPEEENNNIEKNSKRYSNKANEDGEMEGDNEFDNYSQEDEENYNYPQNESFNESHILDLILDKENVENLSMNKNEQINDEEDFKEIEANKDSKLLEDDIVKSCNIDDNKESIFDNSRKSTINITNTNLSENKNNKFNQNENINNLNNQQNIINNNNDNLLNQQMQYNNIIYNNHLNLQNQLNNFQNNNMMNNLNNMNMGANHLLNNNINNNINTLNQLNILNYKNKTKSLLELKYGDTEKLNINDSNNKQNEIQNMGNNFNMGFAHNFNNINNQLNAQLNQNFMNNNLNNVNMMNYQMLYYNNLNNINRQFNPQMNPLLMNMNNINNLNQMKNFGMQNPNMYNNFNNNFSTQVNNNNPDNLNQSSQLDSKIMKGEGNLTYKVCLESLQELCNKNAYKFFNLITSKTGSKSLLNICKNLQIFHFKEIENCDENDKTELGKSKIEKNNKIVDLTIEIDEDEDNEDDDNICLNEEESDKNIIPQFMIDKILEVSFTNIISTRDGSHFFRRIIKLLNSSQRIQFYKDEKFKENFNKICLSKYSNSIIQTFIKTIKNKRRLEEENILAELLKPHLMELAVNQISSFILNQILICFTIEGKDFIFDFLEKNLVEVSNYNQTGHYLSKNITRNYNVFKQKYYNSIIKNYLKQTKNEEEAVIEDKNEKVDLNISEEEKCENVKSKKENYLDKEEKNNFDKKLKTKNEKIEIQNVLNEIKILSPEEKEKIIMSHSVSSYTNYREFEEATLQRQKRFVNIVMKNIFFLVPHKFGHFVIIDCLDNFGASFCKDLIDLYLENIDNFSKIIYGYAIYKRIFLFNIDNMVSLYFKYFNFYLFLYF